jgi:hypothetical protein
VLHTGERHMNNATVYRIPVPTALYADFLEWSSQHAPAEALPLPPISRLQRIPPEAHSAGSTGEWAQIACAPTAGQRDPENPVLAVVASKQVEYWTPAPRPPSPASPPLRLTPGKAQNRGNKRRRLVEWVPSLGAPSEAQFEDVAAGEDRGPGLCRPLSAKFVH